MPHAVRCIECKCLASESPCPACQRKRNKKRAAESYYQTPEWRRKRAEARRLNGNACAICGSKERPVTHHRKGRTEGGQDVQENFMILCGEGAVGMPWASCHSQYEADKRAGKDSELRRLVESP